MVKFVNRAKMTVTGTPGTGAITLNAAVAGYQTFADAGVADADTVRYCIEDGTAWEIGTGTYTASGTSLARSVEESSNADALVSLTSAAEVFVIAAAADVTALVQTSAPATFTAGYDSDAEALGTVTTGTVTPEVDAAGKENFKTLTINGTITIAPPSTSSNCTIIIQVTNGASAAVPTTSGFTIVNGDTYAATNGNDYFFHIKKVGSFSSLTIEALQ